MPNLKCSLRSFRSTWQHWMKGYLPASVAFVPFLSSMFLHASLPHVLLNMWGLAIFGDNVEDRLGHFRYLAFYLVCGLAAGLTHLIFNFNSPVPDCWRQWRDCRRYGSLPDPLSAGAGLDVVAFFVFWLPAWLVLGYWYHRESFEWRCPGFV